MSFIIERTEVFDGYARKGLLDQIGSFYKQAAVREFESREDAEEWIETEKCDPVYDKPFMGECSFEIKEVKKMAYVIRSRETGDEVCFCDTYEEAERELVNFELSDMADDIFETDFYEIVEVEVNE